MPDNNDLALKDLSHVLKEQTRYRLGFNGCVGALDGLGVRIILPSKKNCANPILRPNRKVFSAIIGQAIADGNARFRWHVEKSPGSTHDILNLQFFVAQHDRRSNL